MIQNYVISNIGYCLNEDSNLNINSINNYKNQILTEEERKNLLEKLKKKPKRLRDK